MFINQKENTLCPLTQLVFKGLGEIIGNSAESEISQRFVSKSSGLTTAEQLRGIHAELEAEYGSNSGQGIAVRTGQAAFKYLLSEWGEDLGLFDVEFRMLPERRRLLEGMKKLAARLQEECGGGFHVEKNASHWNWEMETSPCCGGHVTSAPACGVIVGLLQEYLTWISGGKVFDVEEKTCQATGFDYCTIQIGMNPLD
jgi:predicted hydrocarbon binding protein